MKIGLLIAVEDAGQRQDLRRLFQHEFTGLSIDEAGTAAEAKLLLDDQVGRGLKYAVVILRDRLPTEAGKPADFWLSWLLPFFAKEVNINKDPPVYFIVSDNLLNPIIKEFKEEVVQKWGGRNDWEYVSRQGSPSYTPGLRFFARADPWAEQLCDAARPLIHSRRITAGLKEIQPLFGGVSDVDPVGRDSSRASRGSALAARAPVDYLPAVNWSNRLLLLVRDIEDHWQYLEKELRDEIERIFVVRKIEGGRVEVRLL